MRLLTLGHGYVAQALARILPEGWELRGTSRSDGAAIQWPGSDLAPHIAWATHILISAAPVGGQDPFFTTVAGLVAHRRPDWLGYLSTTGVYGDHQGAWVDEETPVSPVANRSADRLMAERAWADVSDQAHIFRIAGIYGPGRAPFARLRAGQARRIHREGQVFSRIHVDDIAQVLLAAMQQRKPGIYNLADDLPAPNADVIAHAAGLAGLPVPPLEDFDTAEMTPMARSFYEESRRICNKKIKADLGVSLLYPDYRRGLQALLGAGE